MSGETVVTVVGNLTSTPELRFIGSGAAVIGFTIASTPRTFDRKTSEWRDGDTLFLRCSLWKQPAENMAESELAAGCRVIAQGRLKQRSFEQDGQKRTVVEMEVDEVGPSLKHATARVTKVSRGGSGSSGSSGGAAPTDDPWGSAPSGPSDDGQPPF
jgi:single-strand DNA-binding protein